MNTGKVKWFDSEKSYGFIKPDNGGDDMFVHISEVEKAGYDNLSNDLSIGYETQTKNRKSSAADLQLLQIILIGYIYKLSDRLYLVLVKYLCNTHRRNI